MGELFWTRQVLSVMAFVSSAACARADCPNPMADGRCPVYTQVECTIYSHCCVDECITDTDYQRRLDADTDVQCDDCEVVPFPGDCTTHDHACSWGSL